MNIMMSKRFLGGWARELMSAYNFRIVLGDSFANEIAYKVFEATLWLRLHCSDVTHGTLSVLCTNKTAQSERELVLDDIR